VVPPHYDSLVAKLIVHGADRAEALVRMERALDFFVIEGIHTSIPLQKEIIRDSRFRSGEFSTRFMESFRAERQEKSVTDG
jgi:acetyl-CoA carboxylase biotin carboxylase subunit